MKKLLTNLSLFNRYLILYLVTAFIPALTACFAIFFSHMELRKEVVRSNQASVQLIQQSLDTKLQELSNVVMLIEQNPALTRYSLKNSQREALTSLENITALQDFLSNIIIKERGTNRYYSANGAYNSSYLKYQPFMINLNKCGYSVEEWENMFESVSTLTYWPVNAYKNSPDYLYLFSPVHSNFQYDSDASRTVVLLIKQKYIQDLFHSSQTSMNENILLLNSDMELLSHLAPNISEASIQKICDYLKNNLVQNNTLHIELEGTENMVFASRSEETGLYYVRFLPENIAFQTIYHIQTYTFIILFFVVAIGIFLILLAMKNSYVPIRTLANEIRSKQPQAADTKDELFLFKQTFDDIIEENALLSQKINESKHKLIDHLLTALIRGNFSTEETFFNACKNLGIAFNKKYFSVCSILIEDTNEKNNLIDFNEILETIRQDLPEHLLVQVKDLLFAQKLLLIFCSDSAETASYHKAIGDIKTRLLLHNGLVTTIGVGSFYDSFEHVGKSYLESTNALDYRLIHGKACLITPDIYNTNFSENSYPTKDLEALHSALMSRNIDMTIASIQSLYRYAKSRHCSLHAAKYICYDTFSILKKMPAFVNMGYVNTLSQDLNITRLTNFETVDDFFNALLNIVQNIFVSENNKEAASNSNIGQELVNYVSTHCFSYDFQVTGMAEHFSMSRQYLRKLFMDYTGMGISDYIMKLKLEKAMQLLRETDMTLQDIVVEIGNTDVSGFIRLFKQKTGMTPGQYRKSFYGEN